MVSLIVAISRNKVIGKDGRLPWNLPAELANFKKITMGHPIIMGRKTYESIGRPLPGRKNIVVTRDTDYKAPGCVVAHSLTEALAAAGKDEEVFVIGGRSLFEEALPLAGRIYLTTVDAEVDGDTYLNLDLSSWQTLSNKHRPVDPENKYAYDFTILEPRTAK